MHRCICPVGRCIFTYPLPDFFFFVLAFHLATHVFVFTVTALSKDFVDRPTWNSTWHTNTLLGTMHSPIFDFHSSSFSIFCCSESISSLLLPSKIFYSSYESPHPTDPIAFTFPFRLLFHPENGDSKLLRNTATYLTRRRRTQKCGNFHINLRGDLKSHNGNEFVVYAPITKRYE
jgi:hypothetical protein